MSGANAIHGIILVGAVIVAGSAETAPVLIVALVAVVLATVNLVGGFVVTDRMLEMFRADGRTAPSDSGLGPAGLRGGRRVFHLGAQSLSSPAARIGNLIGVVGLCSPWSSRSWPTTSAIWAGS